MDLIHIQITKTVISVKINYNKFPKLTFSNVFTLIKYCDVLLWAVGSFSCDLTHTESPISHTQKYQQESQSANQTNWLYSNLSRCFFFFFFVKENKTKKNEGPWKNPESKMWFMKLTMNYSPSVFIKTRFQSLKFSVENVINVFC